MCTFEWRNRDIQEVLTGENPVQRRVFFKVIINERLAHSARRCRTAGQVALHHRARVTEKFSLEIFRLKNGKILPTDRKFHVKSN